MPNSQASTDAPLVSSAYCAIVNDSGNGVLREIIEHLGLLESGCFKVHQKQIGSQTVPFHIVRLDNKYYTCDVPLLCCQSPERFLTICTAERTSDFEISAILFCSTRQQLTDDFLALVSKCSSCMGEADVKALILREDDGTEEMTSSVNLNDEMLRKFTQSRGIEIIKIGRNRTNCLGDEEGLHGIPRVLEIIETVRWPNMKMKPNPVEQREHRTRLQKYIEMEFCDGGERDSAGGFATQLVSDRKNFACQSTAKEAHTDSDYPDSEDEDAILEWFDRPQISEDIAHFSNIPPPHNEVTNLHLSREDGNMAFFLRNLNEVRLSNTQMPLKERVDVSEGIAYDLLGAISSKEKGS
uniref:Uncharacterized protein n=1 Tax=Globodera rostochiensis TaxID=31243 RepID=A0A914HCC6_GLORO